MSVALGALLLASSAVVSSADAQPSYRWHIAKDHWTQADEAGFGKFVQSIGDSNCSSTESCMRSDANPYADTDPVGMDVDADCAKFVYFLRAYYAWKNGLPFSFVSGVSGSGSDLRFSKNGNHAVARHDFVDRGEGIDGPAAMYAVLGSVSSATYRQPADEDKGVLPDFYSPKINPQTIHPGTVLYDVNGHAAIVYRVDSDGRIHYMGASPDFSVSRDVYGAQFGQPPVKLGGGFKGWRPQVLAGARRDQAGDLIGGHIELAHNTDIPNYSLEQYQGTKANPSGDLKDARWDYNGVDLGYYEYVRVAVSGGEMSFNPIYEFKLTMRNLCKEFRDRAASVQQATENGISGKPHPSTLPENIYAQADTTWESYATPKRDARIKAIFAQSRKDLAEMLELWRNRDPRIVYDGLDLKADLERVYNDETRTCSITYLNSAQEPVSLTFDQLVDRLYLMSFDPYDCVEHRWGATGEEASTCKDGDDKQRWYKAEQVYRDKIDPDAMANTGLTLAELEHKDQRQVQLADVDLKSVIDDMGPRVAFAGMTPVGR
jgi:hypothetical protein